VRHDGVEIFFQMKGVGDCAPHWLMTFEEKELKQEDLGKSYEALDIKPLELPSEAVQQLIDELWICGYRPSEGTGSAGSLKATENHLKDMKDCYKDTQAYNDRLLKLIELEYACK